jgi:hypothetical protein
LRTNPKISVGGLGNCVWHPSKNTILYPPRSVPILRNLSSAPTGLIEKKKKTKQNRSTLGMFSFATLEPRLAIGLPPGTMSNPSAVVGQIIAIGVLLQSTALSRTREDAFGVETRDCVTTLPDHAHLEFTPLPALDR